MTDARPDPLPWLRERVPLQPADAAGALYERMASQASYGLAVIHQPFDGRRRRHFRDRGQILDYWASTACDRGSRVLDFGPGDGWPSLLLAPLVGEVLGVDGSPRRVAVCGANAERLGVTNARFEVVVPGASLPRADGCVDAVVAGSSVEQTPDPTAILREFVRVLRPGGYLRMHYESLDWYRPHRLREVCLIGRENERGSLLFFDRHPAEERVEQMLLELDLSSVELSAWLEADKPAQARGCLRVETLECLRAHLIAAHTWRTRHPRCATWLTLLREAGFTKARATRNGGEIADLLYDQLTPNLPVALESVDELLRPQVMAGVSEELPVASSPGQWDPWITACR